MTIDHAQRAKRLIDLIAGESKVNDDSVEDAGVFPESDPPVVPFRYACPTYDGSNTWIEFADTLPQMSGQLVDAIGGECPYSPGEVIDLDTGAVYASVVSVGIVPQEKYMAAAQILARLRAGDGVLEAFKHVGYDPDEVVSEDSSALEIDEIDNNVIDFCDGVLLRRVGAVVRLRDRRRVLTTPGEWTLETY